MDAERHPGKVRGQVNIRWRRVHRIPAQDQQQLDAASRHVLDQGAQRGALIHRLRHHRRRIHHSVADIAQGVIHGMRQGMHQRWLLPPRHDQTGATVLPQILGHSPDPVRLRL